MTEDPIVAEVRRIRDELARRSGYDVHTLCENLRASASTLHQPAFRTVAEWKIAQETLPSAVVREEPPLDD